MQVTSLVAPSPSAAIWRARPGVHLVQRLAKRLIFLILPLDERVAGHAVCEHDAHIVGGGVAVNRYAVVGLLDVLLQGRRSAFRA